MNLDTLSITKIKIETYDNPGWGFEVNLKEHYDKEYLLHEHISEENWFMQFVEDTTLTTIGDSLKLTRIFREVLNYFHIPLTPRLEEWVSLLSFLQQWYTSECDGYWEHTHQVVRGYIDSEGNCQFKISLDETYWDEEPFEAIGDVAMFQCRKEGAKFIGEGKLEYVGIFLQTFKDWIESFDIVVLQTHEYKYYIPASELYGSE